jgi:hypothetical protein
MLKVKTIEAAGVGGGRSLALCDESGNVVGAQISCRVDCELESYPVLTVSFHIDGKEIALDD